MKSLTARPKKEFDTQDIKPPADVGMRMSALSQQRKCGGYSITSSARARIDCGTVSPTVFAVLRLIVSSYGRPLHWQVSRVLPFEDAIDIAGCTSVLVDRIGTI